MLKLYNTFTRAKEEFKPIHAGKVGLYTCGPTVYYYAHIGNLRAYLFEDILRRVLEYNKYQVNHVMNITDVGHLTSDADEGEDKMLKGAKREGKSVWEIAKFYEEAFFADLRKLHILYPSITCRATEHIPEMIALIKRIEHNGYTYTANGNVYFDIAKFKHYGVLARLNLDEQKAGARIVVDEHKHNPQDFVLWFTKSKFENQEMKWDSPWGTGYPGWHIECSAMSMKYLGEHFDIHCGGIDHIPVHHTNEIAQSEAATGKKWVNYWMHNEFLVMDKGKMSKSAGGILTLAVLEKEGYDPIDYRYLTLNTQYRIPLTFSYESLAAAQNAFKNLKNKIIEYKKDHSPIEDEHVKNIDAFRNEFLESINDDLNMPKALAVLWNVITSKILNNHEKYTLAIEFDKIFGLGLEHLVEERVEIPQDIQKIIDERIHARKAKDWKKSDELRDLLKSKGYAVDDGVDGMKVKRI